MLHPYHFCPLLSPSLHELFPFFLKRSLVFPILLFSSISLHWSLRKAFLSLLAILWNSAFIWVYLSVSPLLFTSLHFIAICKDSSDSHFAVLHFFFLGMVLLPVSYTMSWTSVHSSSGTLSIRSSPLIYFSLMFTQSHVQNVQSSCTKNHPNWKEQRCLSVGTRIKNGYIHLMQYYSAI